LARSAASFRACSWAFFSALGSDAEHHRPDFTGEGGAAGTLVAPLHIAQERAIGRAQRQGDKIGLGVAALGDGKITQVQF